MTKLFEYVGGGRFAVGLPKRDLYESDMRRCVKQGWSYERIEAELGELYVPVDDIAAAEEAAEEYDAGETLDWDEVKAETVGAAEADASDTPDEEDEE